MPVLIGVALWVGVAAAAVAGVGLVALPSQFDRLHLPALVTTVAVPAVCVALAVETGPSRAAVKLLLVGALLALTGPAVTVATGQATWLQARRRRSDERL